MALNNDTIELLSVGDVCDRLMISESVAYRLLRSGAIEAFKIGPIWKVPADSINKFIQNSYADK